MATKTLHTEHYPCQGPTPKFELTKPDFDGGGFDPFFSCNTYQLADSGVETISGESGSCSSKWLTDKYPSTTMDQRQVIHPIDGSNPADLFVSVPRV